MWKNSVPWHWKHKMPDLAPASPCVTLPSLSAHCRPPPPPIHTFGHCWLRSCPLGLPPCPNNWSPISSWVRTLIGGRGGRDDKVVALPFSFHAHLLYPPQKKMLQFRFTVWHVLHQFRICKSSIKDSSCFLKIVPSFQLTFILPSAPSFPLEKI